MTAPLHPAEILQALIRFDTTNPPGNEAACIAYIDSLMRDAGLETTVVGRTPERTNLVTRLKGRGDAPPLLLYGHVDVVPTVGQQWTHSPFAGVIEDGYVWGRGAVDMKGPDSMLIAAFLRAVYEGITPPGDVILAMVADEEDTGVYGAGYLVDEHAHLFDGVKYGLSEFGGFSLYIADKRFYPIMMAERSVCTVQVTVRGAGGHGALRHSGTAMTRLAHALLELDRARLPVHISAPVRELIETVAANLDEPQRTAFANLLDPAQTDATLEQLGSAARLFDPLLHNTANPTVVQGGGKVNVIPSEIKLVLDGRVVPGVTEEEFIAELRARLGDDLEYTVLKSDITSSAPDRALFEMLAGVLREEDPEAIPVPYVLSGASDARVFARLGIQTYGFVPLLLPPEFNFAATIHAADERVPISALEFGTNAIFKALQRFDQMA